MPFDVVVKDLLKLFCLIIPVLVIRRIFND
jgi:hypothetical protein